ncbi:porin [Halomonas aquatica]|uniref:Porin n=1 Tax=Halomonas aquatica TaxID=3151123 RepID=A0ABV1NAG6_9GAMM
MKKTLLATAIAGALAASGAQAATVYNQDGTKLDLYGNVQLTYASKEKAQGDGTVESEDSLVDNGSTLGVSGSHQISEGLSGYFKYEFEGDADEIQDGGGMDTGDQAYFGLMGNFGDVRLGSYDPLIDDWIQDPFTSYQYGSLSDSNSAYVSTEDSREGDKLQYMSPSFSGLQFALGTQIQGDAEEADSVDDFESAAGDTVSVVGDSGGDASFFGGVKYTAGAFSIAAAYDNLGNNDGTYTSTDADSVVTTGDFDAGDQYGINAQYTIDTLRLSLKYERFDAGTDVVSDVNYYGLSADYGYGMGNIYAAYQYVDVGGGTLVDTVDDAVTSGDWPNEQGDESYNEFAIGATYNISDAFYTYAEAYWYDRALDEGDSIAVGAAYLF